MLRRARIRRAISPGEMLSSGGMKMIPFGEMVTIEIFSFVVSRQFDLTQLPSEVASPIDPTEIARQENMTRLPRVDSARRFLSTAVIGLAVGGSPAIAQTPSKATPEHIKSVISAVDSASIKANGAGTADWPTTGLD
jgi:hypothetical protein